MPKIPYFIVLLIISGLGLAAQVPAFLQAPFKWEAKTEDGKIEVKVKIPAGCYLYVDKTKITVTGVDGKQAKLLTSPEKAEHQDDIIGKTMVYPKIESVWTWQAGSKGFPYAVRINATGCRGSTKEKPGLCFPPQKLLLMVKANALPETAAATAKSASEKLVTKMPSQLASVLDKFQIADNQSGYMRSKDFISFLSGENQVKQEEDFAARGILLTLLLVVLGGLGLNLTPCVLPMIPINLAIIGAGDQADSKRKGFMRGSAYGAGIAMAYGVLGLVAVLTGARFGTLNSSPWFNLIIGVVFLVLGLAMFDIFNIDFSRFSSGKVSQGAQKGRLVTAFIMGAVAALLAGACVAPVVIAVLIYAATLYSQGNVLGLLLPFLLGVGMALPWPFAGAGMAVIPKPGKWMVRIKQFFGVLIIIAAVAFSWTGIKQFRQQAESSAASVGQAENRLADDLEKAYAADKKVLLDFHASWCANCLKMEKEVFPDPKVKDALKDYAIVKYEAENFDDPGTRAVLDYFKVPGLPTFVILKPKKP